VEKCRVVGEKPGRFQPWKIERIAFDPFKYGVLKVEFMLFSYSKIYGNHVKYSFLTLLDIGQFNSFALNPSK